MDEIRALVAAFADAVNRRDVDAIVALFTPDATWTINGFGEHVGHAGIDSFIRPVLARWDVIMQSVHSGTVTMTGESSADATWYVSETGSRLGSPVTLGGRYTDRCVADGGRWAFGSRTFDLMYEHRADHWVARPLPDDAMTGAV